MDLRELERARVAVAGERALDQRAVAGDLGPLVARRDERTRLNALRDVVDDCVRELDAVNARG